MCSANRTRVAAIALVMALSKMAWRRMAAAKYQRRRKRHQRKACRRRVNINKQQRKAKNKQAITKRREAAEIMKWHHAQNIVALKSKTAA